MLIRAGHHYPFPFIPTPLPIIFRKKSNVVSGKYSFTDSCLYDIGADQTDVNKLIGLSIGWHHNTSFRIGWRPVSPSRIELVAYEYNLGVRLKVTHLNYINIGQIANVSVHVNKSDKVVIYIANGIAISRSFQSKNNMWGYTLGLYFGGNRRAPNDIIINKY